MHILLRIMETKETYRHLFILLASNGLIIEDVSHILFPHPHYCPHDKYKTLSSLMPSIPPLNSKWNHKQNHIELTLNWIQVTNDPVDLKENGLEIQSCLHFLCERDRELSDVDLMVKSHSLGTLRNAFKAQLHRRSNCPWMKALLGCLFPAMRMGIFKNTKFCFGKRCKNPVAHYLEFGEVKHSLDQCLGFLKWHLRTIRKFLGLSLFLGPFKVLILNKSILIGVHIIFLSSIFFTVDVGGQDVCFDVARKLNPNCSLF